MKFAITIACVVILFSTYVDKSFQDTNRCLNFFLQKAASCICHNFFPDNGLGRGLSCIASNPTIVQAVCGTTLDYCDVECPFTFTPPNPHCEMKKKKRERDTYNGISGAEAHVISRKPTSSPASRIIRVTSKLPSASKSSTSAKPKAATKNSTNATTTSQLRKNESTTSITDREGDKVSYSNGTHKMQRSNITSTNMGNEATRSPPHAVPNKRKHRKERRRKDAREARNERRKMSSKSNAKLSRTFLTQLKIFSTFGGMKSVLIALLVFTLKCLLQLVKLIGSTAKGSYNFYTEMGMKRKTKIRNRIKC